MKSFLVPFHFCILYLIATSLSAQLPTLDEKLAGKDKVEEIMEIVEAHYAEIASGKREKAGEGNYKHWMRWGYYMSSRADDQGRLVNVDAQIRKAFNNYTPASRSSAGGWFFRGPSAISGTYGSSAGIGRVDRVAFHPTNANIIYIGTPSGGLFKTTNGGTSWTALTDNIPSVSVSGIVISHADPDVIYILTGDGDSSGGGLVVNSGHWRASAGVFVSYDAGTNWQPTGDFPIAGSFAGYNLAQSPVDEDVLLAATTTGLYRTSNGGATWTEVIAGKCYEVKFKPGSATHAYATRSGQFHRSIDGGLTWTQITNFGDHPLKSGRLALAVAEGSPTRVFLMSGWAPSGEPDNCGDDPDQTFGGIYQSTNSGASFFQVTDSPNLVESCCNGYNSRSQASYDLALAVNHSNVLHLVSGGIVAWRSSTAGAAWISAYAPDCDGDPIGSGFVHADIHDVEYNPLNGHVFLCSDGGIIKSTNNGLDWTNISDGVAASQSYHLAGSLADLDNMIIGLQDNGCKRRNANSTIWDSAVGGDGFDCIYNWGSATTGYMTSNSKVYKFTNNGGDVENVSGDSAKFFTRVTSGINNSNLVLAGRNNIYRSTNGGNSWTNEGAAGFWDLERCPSNPNRFYAAGGNSAFSTSGSMYRSNDAGLVWSVISDSPGYPTGNMRLTDIGARPNSSGHVWITFGGFTNNSKVFFSDDAGESWTNKTGSLPNIPVNAIQVDAGNNVYIGTDIGVFYRGSGMSDWVPFWHRLPIVPVSDLELYEADNMIRASTFGRGVWESDTYSTCLETITLVSSFSGHRYYEASEHISCSSVIFGGANTNVVLKAPDYILLTTGFQAGYGNTIHAYRAPCGVAQFED